MATGSNEESTAVRHPSLREQLNNTTSWYLVRPLQSGAGNNAQVWLASANAPTTAEVDSDDTNGDYVVVKIMQDSLRDCPDDTSGHLDILLWRFQQDLVSSAVTAYTLMADFQGRTLPHFFGHVKSTAPSGEDIDILVFEYLRGPTLEVNFAHPDFAKWADWDSFELLAESVVHTMTTAHQCDILHNDIRDRHLFLDSDHDCLVIIDWEFCQINARDHAIYAFKEKRRLLLEIIKSYEPSPTRVSKWAKRVLPESAEFFDVA